jgi:hypothetical protein
MAATSDVRLLARSALAELQAPEPNQDLVRLRHVADVDGQVALSRWEDPSVQGRVRVDPANAASYRPHLIAACQQLAEAGYPVPGVRCSCGYGLGFLALEPLSTGVLAVWSRRRLVPKLRQGGLGDFAPLPSDQGEEWQLGAFAMYLTRAQLDRYQEGPRTAAQPERSSMYPTAERLVGLPRGSTRPILPAWERRQAFLCRRCGGHHRVLNVTLVGAILRAIADGSGEVVLGWSRGMDSPAARH